MKISDLKNTFASHKNKTLRFILPTGTKVPLHAHVTELARLDKKFVDCGGTFRTESTCRLQTWFADDTAHRLDTAKLLKIFEAGASLINGDDLDVEVEHEAPFISHFPVASVEMDGDVLNILLGTKHTACLASDKCGVAEPVPPAISFKPLPKLHKAGCCG
jgi:hypothetical protein